MIKGLSYSHNKWLELFYQKVSLEEIKDNE